MLRLPAAAPAEASRLVLPPRPLDAKPRPWPLSLPRAGLPPRRVAPAGRPLRRAEYSAIVIPICGVNRTVRAKQTTEVARLSRATSVESVSGDVLLSHAVARAVPSALRGLASGFGMGPGVSLSLWSPKLYGDIWLHRSLGEREPYLGNRTVDACTRQLSPAEVCVVANPRPISTSQLQALPLFHFWPINPVVYAGALLHKGWEISS